MQTIKFIVRKYERKDGGSFIKCSVAGKFVPLALADENTNYRLAFVKTGAAQEPQYEGVYEAAFESGDLWVDTRPEYQEKNILRIKAHRVVFTKPLPKLEKDIREK